MHLNIAQLGTEAVQVLTPVALAIIAYRLKTVEKGLEELKKILFEHVIPKPKD
jgi:hypothetical protein